MMARLSPLTGIKMATILLLLTTHFSIQPIDPAPGVGTIAELELLTIKLKMNFVELDEPLIDSRTLDWAKKV